MTTLINSDFNQEPDTGEFSQFLNFHQLHNHMKEKTCWKSENGSCIDLILSNKKYSLMNTGTLETGLSDHYLLIYSMLKTKYDKLPPKIIKYRQWKHFNQDLFKFELSKSLQGNKNANLKDYITFEKSFETILEKHAPLKTKFLRGNNQPYMTKDLRKAIMLRSRLKNKANKTKSAEDMARFRKQRNFVVNLNRKTKKNFFANNTASSKNFWKAIKPYFGGKNCIASKERILLVENSVITSDEQTLATQFNNFFNSVSDNLNIPAIPGFLSASNNPVDVAIEKFAQHPSIQTIIARKENAEAFELNKISTDTMVKELAALNPAKAISGKIPIKALKLAMFECAETLTSIFNTYVVELSLFPDELKLAEIIPAHKKNSTTDKANYRPISLLPVVSKVFERLIAKQMECFTESFL